MIAYLPSLLRHTAIPAVALLCASLQLGCHSQASGTPSTGEPENPAEQPKTSQAPDDAATGPEDQQSQDQDQDPGTSTPKPEDPKFDLGGLPEPDPGPDPTPDDCEEVEHTPCDDKSQDPLHAIGINCPGESPQIEATFSGHASSRGVISKLGKTKAFDPREGQKYLVLGTGQVADVTQETFPSDSESAPRLCNDSLHGISSAAQTLPAPLKVNKVGTKDCVQDPSLVGTGDCSNTIEGQWRAATPSNGAAARDYTELRLRMTVPSWAHSMAYDFAFLTVEYPAFYQRMFNDFFVAWLESKKWTGNISFDSKQNPISLNAGFLDFRDANKGTPNDPDCQDGCEAPELHGSCFQGHAGTRWLTTTVGVTPGEELELVFAIFDLGDARLDSYVLLDNFRWGCDPQTKPKTDPPK